MSHHAGNCGDHKQVWTSETDFGQGAHTYCVRLLTYLHGKMVLECPLSNQDLYRIGQLVGNVNKILQEIMTPYQDVLQEDDTQWAFAQIPALEKSLSVMDGEPLQEVVKEVIELYKTHVQPNLCLFQRGIIHSDLNHQNILVKPVDGKHHEITGVLDFSLLNHAYFVFEVSISIAYMMMENPRPLDVGGALLAGYESILPLSDVERSSIYPLVLGRMCLSLVNGRIGVVTYPENAEYLLTTAKSGTQLLNLLWSLGKQEVEKKWFSDASKYSALSGQL